eukprot:TRINITY_DN74147_c0_g1_i1.p1 TRINITY_DN74147_c0_g1~~TRINITY_DN74147_c0_g1_i1.p1  ORF type:complete len:840 (+),score=152.46 TRINITY_DN74147_c0_g1_i1:50-2569(+)
MIVLFEHTVTSSGANDSSETWSFSAHEHSPEMCVAMNGSELHSLSLASMDRFWQLAGRRPAGKCAVASGCMLRARYVVATACRTCCHSSLPSAAAWIARPVRSASVRAVATVLLASAARLPTTIARGTTSGKDQSNSVGARHGSLKFRGVRAKATLLHRWKRLLQRASPRPVKAALVLLLILVALTCWGLVAPPVPGMETTVTDHAKPSLKSGLMWLMSQACGLHPSQPPQTGKTRDFLVLLGSTAIGLPLMQKLGVASKVLGYLAIGIVIGPSGFALISDIHWSETLAEAGIVFFLCEMGLELSLDRLKNMRRDVFGLGLAQFTVTSSIIFFVSQHLIGLSKVQACILGAAFSLSSSVFALQLLDETKERGTLHGRSAFGILLFQDLVVPLLLVLLPMLSTGSGKALFSALGGTGQNALLVVPLMLCVRYVVSPLFGFVARARSKVAMRALSFFAVLSMCYIFQIFSLSNTLGAFLAGVLLSETAYKEQVDAAISPIREDLLGLFFITVGFGIDLNLVLTRPILVLSNVSGLLLCKAIVATLVCRTAGMSFANSQQIGLLLCQAGEFSFVMFGIAREVGAFTPAQAKLLLTVTSFSMAATPVLSQLGRELSKRLQEDVADAETSRIDPADLKEKVDAARVTVLGYGRVGRVVTQLLDDRFIPWVAFDVNPRVVAKARAKDLPVFEGDLSDVVTRVLGEEKAATCFDARKLTVVTTAHLESSLTIVQSMRQMFPDMPMIARARDEGHAANLEDSWNTIPVLPASSEDTTLMNLPIGSQVLTSLGYSGTDADAVIDEMRLEVLNSEDNEGSESFVQLLQKDEKTDSEAASGSKQLPLPTP